MRKIFKNVSKPKPMNKLQAAIISIVLICICLVIGYFLIIASVVDTGMISNATIQSKSSFDRKAEFVRAYTNFTGDYTFALNLGYSEEDIKELVEYDAGGTSGDTPSAGGGSGDTPANPNSTDTLDLAKRVCSAMTGNGGNYKAGAVSGNQTVNVNGRSVTPPRNDCSALVAAVLYLQGRIGVSTSDSRTMFGGLSGLTLIADTGSNPSLKFNLCKVGDVFVVNGHTAIVTKIANGNVYMGDAGSTTRIRLTAQDGVCDQVYTVDTLISSWRAGKQVRVFR